MTTFAITAIALFAALGWLAAYALLCQLNETQQRLDAAAKRLNAQQARLDEATELLNEAYAPPVPTTVDPRRMEWRVSE